MKTNPRIPILTYHSLDDSGSVLSISPTLFRSQMDYLRANGWRTLTLDELLSGQSRGGWPVRAFLVTFDDGFANLSRHGLSVLADCGFTAIVFVVSDWVGHTNDWPGQPRWAPRYPLLDWSNVRYFADAGIEVGAHTCSHPNLTELAPATAEHEIVDSKRRIEDETGRAIRTFAYPYGAISTAIREIVGRHFQAGFGTQLGIAAVASSPLAFERIDMYYLRQPLLFRRLENRWLDPYLRDRQRLRDLRNLLRSPRR